jgi:hypothetical protein
VELAYHEHRHQRSTHRRGTAGHERPGALGRAAHEIGVDDIVAAEGVGLERALPSANLGTLCYEAAVALSDLEADAGTLDRVGDVGLEGGGGSTNPHSGRLATVATFSSAERVCNLVESN